MGLYGVIWGYMGLYGVIWGYMGLYGVIWDYMGLYGVIWGYMGLYGGYMGVIWGYMGLYGVIWGYMGLYGVILELGRVPMELFAVKLAIKLEKDKTKEANPPLNFSSSDAMKGNLIWVSNIKEYMEKNGMLSFFINSCENNPLFIYIYLYLFIHNNQFETAVDNFHPNLFETIRNKESKLRVLCNI